MFDNPALWRYGILPVAVNLLITGLLLVLLIGGGGVAERPIVPGKPGNAGGGKEPHFGCVVGKDKGQGNWPRPAKPTNAQTFQKRLYRGAKIDDRVPLGEARRRAGCGKSARPVR